MKAVQRCLLFFLALFIFPVLLNAEEYVFVFHGASTATVYTADTLELVASPEVGMGAVQALGVPDPNQTQSLLKIYVIRPDEVVVLEPDPPFEPTKTLPLSAPIGMGEKSAFLTPDGSKLIVVGGDFLHVFDAIDPTNPAGESLLFANLITGAAATTTSKYVSVITQGSTAVRSVDLEADTLSILPDIVGLPAIPKAIGTSPNGSGLYVASDDMFFEISALDFELTTTLPTDLTGPRYIGFDPDAPVGSAFVVAGGRLGLVDLQPLGEGRRFNPGDDIIEAATPGGGFLYMITAAEGDIRRARFGVGGLPVVDDPETGLAFGLPAIDVEAAGLGGTVFFAFGGDGLIVELSQDGAEKLAEVVPPMPTTGISVLEVFAPFRSELQIYGGEQQFGDVDDRLARPIAVRLLSLDDRPLFRKTITFESEDDAEITPTSALTNMFGVATATVIVPSLGPFTVRASATDVLSTTFSLNTGGEGFDGLSKVGGDYQYVVSEEPLARISILALAR